jgi:hypothetical protein
MRNIAEIPPKIRLIIGQIEQKIALFERQRRMSAFGTLLIEETGTM